MNELSPYRIFPELIAQPSDFTGNSDPAGAITLRDYWQVLRRRKALILQIWLTCLALTFLICVMVTPIFEASAVLLVQRQAPQVLDIQNQLVAPELPDADHDF